MTGLRTFDHLNDFLSGLTYVPENKTEHSLRNFFVARRRIQFHARQDFGQ